MSTNRNHSPDPTLDRVLSDKQICAWFGIGRSTLWRLGKSDHFPKKIQISPGRKGRSERELSEWLEARKEARALDPDRLERFLAERDAAS